MTLVFGYARTSTFLQETSIELQQKKIKDYCQLKGWYCSKIFIDEGKSGKSLERKAWQNLMQDVREKHPHAIVFTKLDRVGRSLQDLLAIVAELKTLDVSFVSIDDSIDTSTPQGKFQFQLLGAVAEYERSIIRARLEEGAKRAREKGKTFGRHPVKIDETLFADMASKKVGPASLARYFKISRSTAYKKIAVLRKMV